MEEISNILDNFLYKDVKNIVLDYTYHKCKICKRYIFDEYVNYCRKDIICSDCIQQNGYRLCRKEDCEKYYLLSNNPECYICDSKCKVFCYDCSYQEIINKNKEKKD